MSAPREWKWGYWSAYVSANGSISWSNHEHKASTRQSGEEFLANGPAGVVARMGSVPSSVLRQIERAVRDSLKGGKK